MAEFNLKEVLIKSRDEAVAATSKEAAAATVRAVKRIANPPKKSLPAPTLKKAAPAPPWFKYGIYAAIGLVGLVVVKSVVD
jgi:hypothetical protein